MTARSYDLRPIARCLCGRVVQGYCRALSARACPFERTADRVSARYQCVMAQPEREACE